MASTPPENESGSAGDAQSPSPRRNTYVTRSPIQLAAGTLLIGTYELQEHINTGGMGEVYRGVNIHNDEVVAIKIVLPALAHDDKILSLFQKESTVLRRISHDAIVRYEVFTIDPDIARPCLVMEYVAGPSLNDMMDFGPMPAPDVLTLMRRLAGGLAIAHGAGVVHRDLSPDNVILPERSVDRAKIIDFGIAKATTPGGRTLIGGQFAGKPGYVAPEQLGLYDGVVSGQADVYSLGLMGAAAALGRPIDMGDSPAAAVLARADVPDLTQVPDDLRPLFTWMLQPDPKDRPANMADVIGHIDSLAAGPVPEPRSQPPESLPPSSMPPVSTPPADHPGTSTVAASATGGADQIAPARDGPASGASPFGPAPSAPASAPLQPAPKRKGGLIGALLVLMLAVAGGGAWYTGLMDGVFGSSQTENGQPTAPPVESAAARAWLNAEGSGLGPCLWLPRLRDGAAQDGLRAYAASADDLAPLRNRFSEQFGQPLDLRVMTVSAAQCAALDAIAALDARRSLGASPQLQIQSLPDNLPADAQGLSGRLVPPRAAAFFMVDPSGQIQNIAATLSDDGTFNLSQSRLRRITAAPEGNDASAAMLLALHSSGTDAIRRLIPENAMLPSAQAGEFWGFLVQALDQPDTALAIGVATVGLAE